jgi:hypothetical protein
MAAYRSESLEGRWVRSYEEDTDDELVFRPASYDFPPTRRGRRSIELCADGAYIEQAPGAVDAPEESARGSWSVDGDHLVLATERGGEADAWEITAAEPDRLTVKR